LIAVNRKSIPKIEFIGKHKTPVIIIDDYADNHNEITEQVRDFGCFSPDNVTNYPGIRSPIPKALVVGYLRPLMQMLYRIYRIPDNFEPSPIDNYFSLITSKPNELSAMQSWPHFDTPNPNFLAVLHYLDNGSHGGTGFFRHNKSDLERIDEKSKDDYYKYAHDYFQTKKTNTFGYCTEQHSEFTCYKKIDYKPNRLIVFPGQLLHSTLVDLKTDLDPTPESGRLTANLFAVFN
jgi:hypothetical protein